MAGDLGVNGTKPVDKPMAIDGADEFALDVAGLVEAGVDARFHLHMQRKGTVGSRKWKYDHKGKPGSERVWGADHECRPMHCRLFRIWLPEVGEP
jgi:hypothetical protein